MRKSYTKRPVEPLFSDEDADMRQQKWRLNGEGYAWLCCKKATVSHRIVMSRVVGRELATKEIVDHKNGIKTDNQRTNLQITDKRGNAQNRRCRQHRGAYWNKKNQKWVSIVRHKFFNHYMGYFDDPAVAALFAKQKRIELNFLGESPLTDQELAVIESHKKNR